MLKVECFAALEVGAKPVNNFGLTGERGRGCDKERPTMTDQTKGPVLFIILLLLFQMLSLLFQCCCNCRSVRRRWTWWLA